MTGENQTMKIDFSNQVFLSVVLRVMGILMLSHVLGSSIALGQEPPEKRLTKEELSRTEVAVIVERLRSLRRNAERFGPKHPAFASVQKQIAALESQLSELTAKSVDGAAGLPGVMPSEKNDLKEHLPSGSSAADRNSSVLTSDWGFDLQSKWPTGLDRLIVLGRQHSEFEDAYPWLGLRDMVAVGPMPGMGLMWGIQYDPVVDRSYIFQWFDDPGCARRVLFYECSGRLKSVYFPRNFDVSGCFWVLRLKENVFSVESVQAERLPPYEVASSCESSPSTLLRFEQRDGEQVRVFSSQQSGWFFSGGIDLFILNPLSEDLSEELVDVKKDSMGSDPGAAPLSEFDTKIVERIGDEHVREWLDLNQIVGLQTNREVLSVGVDSTGSPLFVDAVGRIAKLSKSRGTEIETVWPPKRLSELGWYLSIKEGAMREAFKPYTPKISSEVLSLQGAQMECLLEADVAKPVRLKHEHWYCVPYRYQKPLGSGGMSRFPNGTILLNTISTVPDSNSSGDGATSDRIETRVLISVDDEWHSFSYRWNSDQEDGELVEGQRSVASTIQEKVSGADSSVRDAPIREAANCFECHRSGPIGLGLQEINNEVESVKDSSNGRSIRWSDNYLGLSIAQPAIAWDPILAEIESTHASRVQGTIQLDWYEKSMMTEVIEPWYRASFRPSGFFCTELDEQWTPAPKASATLVSQSRQIYSMAQGYFISRDPRYLDAVNKGIGFLLGKFKDPKLGGFYYQVSESGEVLDAGKDGYGHAFAIYALATAGRVSGNASYSAEAMDCWELLRSKMMEPNGGLMWRSGRDFSGLNRRSQNPNMHLFEGLLELYAATKNEGVYRDTKQLLDFVVGRLRHRTGIIPEDYKDDWDTPSPDDINPSIMIGHQVEWAFLISRAVELGFPSRYLDVGRELLSYAMENGYDPESGGLREGPSRGKGGWQQAEFIRALLRYYSMHGCHEYEEPIQKTQAMIRKDFIDPNYGGWIEWGKKEKGNHWKAASHEVAMYVEGIRISRLMKSQGKGTER